MLLNLTNITSGMVYSAEETGSTCILVRLGTGVSYVLIYSSLLVKLIFLITLNTGVYLPAMYQALLLFFAIIVQVKVNPTKQIFEKGAPLLSINKS